MCNSITATSTSSAAASAQVSLTAAGELRDALTALRRGNAAVAVSALMAIDPESWAAMEARLSAVGGDLRELLEAASENAAVRLPLH
ncbi:hypothetical protein DB35_03570 [Streptomyces abyssalis]|uniref:Uncharacterized protein n=1 Tax=Streptomyces abyssalis TaxID=933944 RepID=A0A1E7JQ20_9ACTN|nr:hypothetical protein [Streptomyces abyssalis]OEU90345.1 hypothetical protein AN215_12685 [Streptomyces abyssalis]OEU95082.1 hypothetical protein DB35_03570 [Streptomyces abyssalis]